MTLGQLASAPEDIRKRLMKILDGTKTDDNQLERLANLGQHRARSRRRRTRS